MDSEIINTIFKYCQYFLTGVGVGVGLYYAKFTLPFILWIKGGIEDQDGKLENKELQIAFASAIIIFIVVTIWLGAEYPDSIIWGSFGLVAGLFGIKEIYGNKK